MAASLTLVYLYQDKIIQLFVQEANKHLKTEVQVGKISLSLFDKFPHLAIKFDKLRIAGAVKSDKRPMATAEKLYGTFDLRDLWAGRYIVSSLYLEDAEVLLLVDKEGNENFDIFQRVARSAGEAREDAGFDLNKILLNNVNVRYERGNDKNESYELLAKKITARFSTQAGSMDITLAGEILSRQILVDRHAYFKNKLIKIDSQLRYRIAARELTIQPSILTINQGDFTVQGQWKNLKKSHLDLAVRSNHTDAQTLLSLLPEETARKLKGYQSKGELFFNGTVKGYVSNGATPRIEVRFGCKNATLIHPKSGKHIASVFLTGAYTNGRLQNLNTSSLNLNNISGSLDGRPFSGDFALLNFKNPMLIFKLKGAAEVGSLLAFYPIDKIERAQGEIALQVNFEGKISDLKAERLMQYVHTSGEISVKNLQFKIRDVDLLFDAFNGNFQFQRSDLRVNNFSGRAGNSDFLLTGYFKNIMAYLLLKEEDLGIEANVQSRLLDFDELLTTQNSTTTQRNQVRVSEPYRFHLSPRLSLDLNCRIDRLHFRRFNARHLRGQLDLNDQVAQISDFALQTAGGSIDLDAKVSGRQSNRTIVEARANFDQIAVDSTFYMFENFQQTFIQDRNLKGKLSSDVHTFMVFDEYLNLLTPMLKADIQASITDGELNNFAPMQKLSVFLRRRELANIRFSELKNDIHIENRTVSIPEMEIQSSVSNISIFGTHTFDQVMDYHLRFPLSNLARPDKDEKFGTVAQPERGRGNLLLAIKGNSDSFKITYDVKEVGKKISEDLQLKKGGLKNIFKKKEPPAKETEEEKQEEEKEEEYFDFH